MASAVDTLERIIGRLYTNFILRDLTFIFSGAVVLVFAIGEPLRFTQKVSCMETEYKWAIILAFLAVSYVLGVLLQEAARLPLEKVSKCKIENSELPEEDNCGYVRNEPLVVKTERLLRNKNFEHTLNGLERILFLKQVAATQFSVLGAVAIVLITRSANNPSQSLGPIFALLFLGMALCRHMYLEKALQQEKIIYGLLKRGENKPSNSGTEEKKTDPE